MRWEDECKSLIDDGICHADCCGIVPFPVGFYESHIDAARKVKKRVFADIVPSGLREWIIGQDERCVFVDPDSSLCKVYDDRPNLCRIFGPSEEFYLRCPWLKPDGTRRTRSERRRFHKKMQHAMKYTSETARIRGENDAKGTS